MAVPHKFLNLTKQFKLVLFIFHKLIQKEQKISIECIPLFRYG